MKKTFAIALTMSVSLGLLGGCSTSKPLVEPKMDAIESDYSAKRIWQVKLERMPTLDTEGLFFSEDGTHLYIATETGHVASLIKDSKSRWLDQVKWQTKFDSAVISGPTLDNGELLLGTSKGQLISLAAQNGDYNWQSQLSSEVIGRPVVANGKIFTRTVDGKVYALNRKNGKVLWVAEHQMPSLSLRGSPEVVYSAGRVFVGWESGIVQALSAKSGVLLWETRVAVPSGRTDLERIVDVQARLIVKGNRLFVMGYHGKLVSINIDNGQFYFVKDISGYRDFVIDKDRMYVVDDQDVLYSFDINTGFQVWKQSVFKNRLVGDLALSKGDVLAVDSWGYMHWLSKLHGTEIGRVKHSNEYGDGNKISRVFTEDSKVYLLDEEGVITAYKVGDSNLKQFKLEHEEFTNKQPVVEMPNKEKAKQDQTKDDDTPWYKKLWPFS